MIPRHEITAAVLDALTDVWPATFDLYATGSPTGPYLVLEHPPATLNAWPQPLGDPTGHLRYSFRVRVVASDFNEPASLAAVRESAERLADLYRTGLLAALPLTGATWAVTHLDPPDSGGVDAEGNTVNIVDDWTATATPV